MVQVIGKFATASLLYTLWLQIETLTSEKASFVGVAISDSGTKTCLLCPQGQLQSLNCDKIPQLHSMDKKAIIETPSCQTIPNYIPN